MNPSMIGDNDLLLIEDYLDGELSATAREQFEQRLAAEPELAAELAVYQKMNQHLDAQLKADKMAEWQNLIPKDLPIEEADETPVRSLKPSPRRRLYYIASAAAAVLLILAFFFLLPGPSNPTLAQNYWGESATFFSTLTERGAPTAQPAEQSASKAYLAGQYQQVLNILLLRSPLSEEERLLKGAAYFQLQQTDQAIGIFKQLLDDADVLSKDEARWCLALAYLQKDQGPQAKPLLQEIIDQQAWNWKPATRLLKEINE